MTRLASARAPFSLKGRRFAVPARHPGAAAVDAARAAAVTALGGLPFARLSGEDRRRLGAQLFRAAGALVDQVARSLLAQPARYADLGARAAGLRERQAEADAWLALRGALGHLHVLAGDSYLQAQAEVLAEAQALLAQVRGEGETGEARARAAGLIAAIEIARAVAGRRVLQQHQGPAVRTAPEVLRAFREALAGR